MRKGKQNLRWGVERRLEFIEFRLYWEGSINRSDIMGYFGVSVPQASKDLSQYQELAPANIRYDLSNKKYFATDKFTPRFLRPDAGRYLSQLRMVADRASEAEDTWLSSIPDFDAVPMPVRNVDTEVVRAVAVAVRNRQAIEIRYQSLSAARPKPIWRWISPHAFAFDGHRWHVRAFCHIDRSFKDFLLPRVLGTRGTAPAEADPSGDHIWVETIAVVLKPNPGLGEDQKHVVELDYGMKNGELRISVRLALLYYLLRRLRLGLGNQQGTAREHPLVVSNQDVVKEALDRANVPPLISVA